MKVSVGIDIGADGALAIVKDGKLVKYCKIHKTAKALDMFIMIEDIMSYILEGDVIHVVIEDLHSVFGSSAKSNFSFGLNNGLIIGALQAIQLPYTKVAPKKWQKEMWEGVRPVMVSAGKGKKNKDGSPKYKVDTKSTSLQAAKRIFPTESFLASERSKVPHDGIVDAVLMAVYCDRNF
jgi:hypothetical protein